MSSGTDAHKLAGARIRPSYACSHPQCSPMGGAQHLLGFLAARTYAQLQAREVCCAICRRFYLMTVWLVPFALFLSLAANDQTLPGGPGGGGSLGAQPSIPGSPCLAACHDEARILHACKFQRLHTMPVCGLQRQIQLLSRICSFCTQVSFLSVSWSLSALGLYHRPLGSDLRV